jgi:hypothetical protein
LFEKVPVGQLDTQEPLFRNGSVDAGQLVQLVAPEHVEQFVIHCLHVFDVGSANVPLRQKDTHWLLDKNKDVVQDVQLVADEEQAKQLAPHGKQAAINCVPT